MPKDRCSSRPGTRKSSAPRASRTASITGAFVALALALERLRDPTMIKSIPLTDYVAAISVGIADSGPLPDLPHEDDSPAEVDMNIVKTGDARFIETHGTPLPIPLAR